MTYLVHWVDEPGRTRAVTHICAVCKRFLKREYGLTLDYDSHIVSPTGRAHVQADHNEGYTACGRDATGLDWWWKT